MENKALKPNKHSVFYACILIFAVIFFLISVIFGRTSENAGMIAGAFVFMLLLAIAIFDMKKVLWAIVFILPMVIGLSNYQINISSLIQNILPIGDIYANSFSLICLFLIFLAGVELLRIGKESAKIPLFYILLLSSFLSLAISFSSKYFFSGIVFEIYLLAGFAAYFLGYIFLNSKENYIKTIFAVIFSSVIPAGVGIFQLLAGKYFFENDSDLGRIAATFPHPNTFGSFLFVVLALALVAFFAIELKNKKNGISKLLSYAFAGVLGVLFILTYSRTAWSGFLVALLAVFILVPRVRWLMVYSGFLLSFVILIFEKTRERIMGIFEHHMFDSMYGRYQIWDMALYRSWRKPFIGYGIGSFSDIIKDTQGKATGNVYPHNDIIRFFLEGGILGVSLYLLYMLGALYYAAKSFLCYPKIAEKISFWGKEFEIEMKTLGVIPLVLFGAMVVISIVEAPSMDFVYQILSWIILGSWMGISEKLRAKN